MSRPPSCSLEKRGCAIGTPKVLDLLRQFESPNVTFIEPDQSWPIVWERARGVWVWDPEGRRYLDLTGAFGVAAAGHANHRVVRAGQAQMGRLLHAMGDVHPHALKAGLARELSRLTFERWSRAAPAGAGPRELRACRLRPAPTQGKTIFCNSGFEAVEAALKTALLATGRKGIIAFEGAYHGLGYGALNATQRDFFRRPFLSQLARFGHFVPFPSALNCPLPKAKPLPWNRLPACPLPTNCTLAAVEQALERVFRRHSIGAILVEPVQARGGIRVPAAGFLPLLRRLCDRHGALLIADEIYTGMGRTGRWFACEHAGVAPDLICLGKALTGGFPLSACVGRADLMDAAWPVSTGEALHTSTFLGHPVGCAMALAQIGEIRRLRLADRSARLGRVLLEALAGMRSPSGTLTLQARGLGLMAGLDLRSTDGRPATEAALRATKEMLRRRFILLPEGEHANVIGFTPPLTIPERELGRAVAALGRLLP